MEPIRVVLVGLPRLLRAILHNAAADTPDIRLSSEAEDLTQLDELVRQARPDAIILSRADGSLPPAGAAVIDAEPGIVVAVLADQGREMRLYRYGHAPLTIPDPSPSGILRQVRSAWESGRGPKA